MNRNVQVVLVTGGSSGIGAETAALLSRSGMTVYAASRRGTCPATEAGIIPIRMDVTDEALTREAVETILREQGHLDAVVCNAGNGIFGPVEGTTAAEAQSQFETCYFGALKTIQACLPAFRRQGFGRIITVTSVMAILQLPFQGFYSSAKAALLSLSESLSLELHGTGIECCSILPGDVRTGFTSARRRTAAAEDPASPYKAAMERNLRKIEHDETTGMAPSVIARAILRQLKRRHMRVRVIPRADYGAVGLLTRILPEKPKLALIRWLY